MNVCGAIQWTDILSGVNSPTLLPVFLGHALDHDFDQDKNKIISEE